MNRPPSDRERQVWMLLARGLSNRAIAARLGTELKTVDKQISALYLKLRIDAKDREVNARVQAAHEWNRI